VAESIRKVVDRQSESQHNANVIFVFCRLGGYSPLTRKNGLGRPVVAGAVGVGIGLVLGDRLVKTYDWCTEWFIPALLPVVYGTLTSRSASGVCARSSRVT